MLAAAVLICAVFIAPLDRGREFLERGDTAAALYWFQEAVQANPRDPEAWRYAGEAYGRLGRHEEAVGALKQSLLLAPDAATYSELSRAYMGLGRWDEAAAAEEEALKRRMPTTAGIWYFRVADTSVDLATNISDNASRSSQNVAASVSAKAKSVARGFKRAFAK